MKNILLLLILHSAVIIQNSFSQSPNWLWAKSAGGLEWDESLSVAADKRGNIYLTGYFTSDSILFGNFTLYNTNSPDKKIFIVKYDSSGTAIWARSSACPCSNSEGNRITVDDSGNVYVTGDFYGPNITFGSFTLTDTFCVNPTDLFIVKYDSYGNVQWLNGAQVCGNNWIADIAADKFGNVYAIGSFAADSITFSNVVLTNNNLVDNFFIVKYNSSGNVLWAKNAVDTNAYYHMAMDTAGNVYIRGNSHDSLLLVKYTDGGNISWIRKYDTNISIDKIATDFSGNIYGTGNFTFNIIVGSDTLINHAYCSDILIVKFDSLGNILWGKGIGGTWCDRPFDITTDNRGNFFITGDFWDDTLNFDGIILNNIQGEDMYVVKYDSNGIVKWATSIGSVGQEAGTGVAANMNGDVYVSGVFSFNSTMHFGSTTLMNPNGPADIFISKLDTALVTGYNEVEKYDTRLLLYPNPAANKLIIHISLSKSQNISLKIFDISGRLVTTLADKVFESGENEIVWNTAQLKAEVYFLQFQSDVFTQTEKLIVTK